MCVNVSKYVIRGKMLKGSNVLRENRQTAIRIRKCMKRGAKNNTKKIDINKNYYYLIFKFFFCTYVCVCMYKKIKEFYLSFSWTEIK